MRSGCYVRLGFGGFGLDGLGAVRLGLGALCRVRLGVIGLGAVGIGAVPLCVIRRRVVGLRSGFGVGLGGRGLRCVRLGVIGLGAVPLGVGFRCGCDVRLGFGGFGLDGLGAVRLGLGALCRVRLGGVVLRSFRGLVSPDVGLRFGVRLGVRGFRRLR